ncbi:MAG: dihydrofolate reductase family protein [Ignavibacteriales bacterium]|nr:dihydrofolate reductase family protein [Ignavibacteriales bacterium]
MRKLFWFNLVTLDGYFEGPNREIDWHNVDEEFNELAIEQLKSLDLLLFGRVTYELMASYWPTETAMRDDPIVADKMNSISKIVFSKTLEKAEWENTKLIRWNVEEEISILKQEPGKDIAIFGSAELVSTFTQKSLIDEYRIMVNPVVLGNGNPLFKGFNQKFHLKLINSKTFNSGNVLLYYKPL